jgi:hypothetical protein
VAFPSEATFKPVAIKPPYSYHARLAGRMIMLAIAFNIVVWIGTLLIRWDPQYSELIIWSRLVVLSFAALAFVFASRGIQEVTKSTVKLGGFGEAVAAIIIGVLGSFNAVLTLALTIVRLIVTS